MSYSYNTHIMKAAPQPSETQYVTKNQLDEVLAEFFGKLTTYFDARFAEMEARLDATYGPTLVVCDALQKYVTDTSHCRVGYKNRRLSGGF